MYDNLKEDINQLILSYESMLFEVEQTMREDYMITNQEYISLTARKESLTMFYIDLCRILENIKGDEEKFLNKCIISPVKNTHDINAINNMISENADLKIKLARMQSDKVYK